MCNCSRGDFGDRYILRHFDDIDFYGDFGMLKLHVIKQRKVLPLS